MLIVKIVPELFFRDDQYVKSKELSILVYTIREFERQFVNFHYRFYVSINCLVEGLPVDYHQKN